MKSAIRFALLAFFILFIASCATTPENPKVIQPESKSNINNIDKPSAQELIEIQQLESKEDWSNAFSRWKAIADESNSKHKNSYYNRAALMLYKNQQIDYIEGFYNNTLNHITFSDNDLINKKVLLAVAYFNNGKTYQSLSTLPDLKLIKDEDFLLVALDVKAKGILNIGNPIKSTKIRLEAEKLLKSAKAIELNQTKIWQGISRISEKKILASLKKPETPELRGWLELSLIARRSNMIPEKIEPWIIQWHKIYPQHSAQQFADALLKQSKEIYINPTRVALMLPLSGKLAKVSQAIQDGFLYAYYNAAGKKPELEIISIDKNKNFQSQYQTAIDNGADVIVGPLNKKHIEELSKSPQLPIPTLALNYANDTHFTQNLFEFGLKPEDEAEQVADYALLDNNYRAATLMPNNSWGKRINDAFKQRYESLGGSVLSEVQYDPKSNDYGTAIQKMLNLSQSKSRHRIINTIIGTKTEFHPRRRQDIDLIFIGANARQARIIKPQLKFHYAEDIQTYATSSISKATNSADNDRDLNGILYVDMPWTLKGQAILENKEVSELWPNLSSKYSRLFALGIDAYRVIPKLKRLKLNNQEYYTGLTGNLSIDQQGRIHRKLLLATYKKGKPKALKPPAYDSK